MAEQIAKESNPQNPKVVIEGIAGGVPLGSLGNILKIVDLAGFLCSDESADITGAQVFIDGGSTFPETVSVGV